MRKVYKLCPKDVLCQISENLDCQILSLFATYWAPIETCPLIFAKLNPHSQRYFLPNLVQIISFVLEKKSFKGKVYGMTDDGRTGHGHYSSLEPSTQVS